MQDILKVIQERHSTRMPYDPQRPISRADLTQILEAARWAPTAHNMQNFEIVVVDDKVILDEIAAIHSPVSPEFIRENYPLLSFSEAELRQKKVGILGNMFPPSWRTPGVKPEPGEGQPARSFPVCPALLVLLYDPSKRAPASGGDFLGHISLGCMVENLWLAATALGIDFHVVSPLANEPAAGEVKRILGIPAGMKIVFTVRLGYAISAPQALRVRREISDFSHFNHFGNKGN